MQDGKLVHSSFPVVSSASPFGGNVAQSQPDQLGGSIIAREVPARFDDLTQPGVRGYQVIAC